MASIRERTRKDGVTSWAVLWRDADTGKQTSRTLATQADAQSRVDFLNANGQSFALAAQPASKMRSLAPSVAAAITGWLKSDHLRVIGSKAPAAILPLAATSAVTPPRPRPTSRSHRPWSDQNPMTPRNLRQSSPSSIKT